MLSAFANAIKNIFWRTTGSGPKTPDGTPVPFDLKLEFSKAADIHDINHIFEPAIKPHIDPHNFVVKRMEHVFHATVENEGAAILRDQKGEIFTMTMAYHLHEEEPRSGKAHDYTEIGTTITRLPGYSSAHIVITVQTLKEWWEHEPRELIVAEIDPDNAGSVRTFCDKLEWKPIEDKALNDFIITLCDESVHPDQRGGDLQLYYCNESSMPRQAGALLSFMNQKTLKNKKTGHKINIDFNVLTQIGLTRKRLEAIASGITDKKQLKAMSPA